MYLLALFMVSVCALWKLDEPPWYCDAKCRNTLYKLQKNSTGCITRQEFGDYPFQLLGFNSSVCSSLKAEHNARFSYCVRLVKEKFVIANCNFNITDHRIPCRKVDDTMSWYRGMQSVTVSGKQCIRWDSISTNFAPSRFDELDASSLLNNNIGTLSYSIHAHENYCRNPDGWSRGPWCIVEQTANGDVREPCFRECAVYNEPELCLAKMFFPYSIPSTSNIPHFPSVQSRSEDIRDLSDILDVPRITQFHHRNRPMFVPTVYLDYVRYHPGDISTRLRCYQTGIQNRIAGPWIYTSTVRNPFPKHAVWLEEAFAQNSADFMDRERAARGDTGPHYSLWRPCFLACEDTNVKCWPVQQDSIRRPRFPYYGSRNFDAAGTECVSPHYAFQILVMQNRLNKTDEKQLTLLKVLRETFITNANGTRRLRNLFAISKGNMMVSRRCFTLGDFLRGVESGAREEIAEENEELRSVMSIGAGCFTETGLEREDDEDELLDDSSNQSKNISEFLRAVHLSDSFNYQPVIIMSISAFCIIAAGLTALFTMCPTSLQEP